MCDEQFPLCLCDSLELLVTRRAATTAQRKPQENST